MGHDSRLCNSVTLAALSRPVRRSAGMSVILSAWLFFSQSFD